MIINKIKASLDGWGSKKTGIVIRGFALRWTTELERFLHQEAASYFVSVSLGRRHRNVLYRCNALQDVTSNLTNLFHLC
ncbi:hypothetical protein CmeUKMEL1_08280 [Cryptosporidium meleagridis]|uniref:Uncharacterized protein n=1 Tax=Cryptosporidium meleagridis TaxID=93969 RepID=A0A2P4Z0K6_9CRYT|nr:hypothetical protein CmeUKMEL1_08280 [Cryptosporidium meleagridis]